MKLRIITDHPIAVDSYDHIHPHGTKQDNTANEQFIEAVIKKLGKVKYADLGCAGGWFARAFHNNGQLGVGVEGSDYSKIHKRAEWEHYSNILFTADITKPFHFVMADDQQTQVKFNIMSAFDVLEHIPEDRLGGFIDNLRNNLEPGGYFVASIANSEHPGYHVTLKPAGWWLFLFEKQGFVREEFLIDSEYGRRSDYNITLVNMNK